MEIATQTHLATLRHLLEFRQRELQVEVAGAGVVLAPASEEVHDRKDEAAASTASRIEDAQRERDLQELREVEAALRRLDANAYGDCEACAEPIAFERLRVQPAALRCAHCQSAFEHQINARSVAASNSPALSED